jgi:hypothetical protein
MCREIKKKRCVRYDNKNISIYKAIEHNIKEIEKEKSNCDEYIKMSVHSNKT